MHNGYAGFPMMNSERRYENNYNFYPADKYYKFSEAYNEADRSRALINARLDRLKCESDALKIFGRNSVPRGVNPSMYSYQVTEPAYYPLENPIKGEPLVLPKIEMGIPVQKLASKKSKKCKNNCNNNCKNENALSISDIVALMNMNKMNNQNNTGNQCSSNCQNYCAHNKMNNFDSGMSNLINNISNLNNNKGCQNHCNCDVKSNHNNNCRYNENVCNCNNYNDRVNQCTYLPDPRFIQANYEQRYRTPLKGIQISQKLSNSQRKNEKSEKSSSSLSKSSKSHKKSSSVVTKSSANSSIISPTPPKMHSPSIEKSALISKKASIIERMSMNVDQKSPNVDRMSLNVNQKTPYVERMSSININQKTPYNERMSSLNVDKLVPEIEPQPSTPEQIITDIRKNSIVRRKSNLPSKKSSVKEQIDIPEIKVSSPEKIKFDWWKATRNFVNMYKFFSIGDKLGKTSLIRDEEINEMTKLIFEHINSISSWLITIEESFINELKAYNSLNINFTDKSNKNNFKKCSDNIMTVLTKFLTNLLVKSKPSDLPEKIQDILYKYIKENAYVPKKYLSTFEITRLDFNFYGGIKNITENQAAMILVYFIISRAMIQKILLLPKQSLPQYKNSTNIQPSCFILGSVLHYLVRGAFSSVLPMIKEFLPLVNYYRNYHLTKKQIEEQIENNENEFNFEDADEISKNLIPENDLNQFWKENAAWADSFKQKIFNWALGMVKIIKSKQGGDAKKNIPNKK